MANNPIQNKNPKGVRPQKKDDGLKDAYRINDRIFAKEVRLVGDNVEQGIYSIRDARAIAEEQELDLVEISPNAAPPVCRIIDFQKFIYQQKKRQKEQKAKSTKVVVKDRRPRLQLQVETCHGIP